MLNLRDNKYYLLYVFVLFAFFFTCSFPTVSYAFSEKYINNYDCWYEIEDANTVSDEDILIRVKCIPDTADDCFYIYVYYFYANDDTVIQAENISLSFNIENEITRYSFIVGKNYKLDSNIGDNFEIIDDYSNINDEYNKGEFVVGIHFKNKNDTKLLNLIDCDLSLNNSKVYNLFDSYEMDMYIPPETTTQKVTTTKVTTTKATTTKSTTQKETKATTTKSQQKSSSKENNSLTGDSTVTKNITEKSTKTTKVVTSTESSSKEKSTKFVPSNTYKSNETEKASASTVVQTTKKNRSVNASTKPNVSRNVRRSSRSKTNSSKYTTRQKYKPSNATSLKTTKFDPNTGIQNETVVDESSNEETTEYQYDLVSRKLKTSDKTKAMIAFASVVMAVGIGLVAVGTLSGKYKIVKNVEPNIEPEDSNNNDEHSDDKNDENK